MAATRPSGSTPLPAAGNRPSVIAIDGDAMRGVTVGTATGLYAKELVERANMAERRRQAKIWQGNYEFGEEAADDHGRGGELGPACLEFTSKNGVAIRQLFEFGCGAKQ